MNNPTTPLHPVATTQAGELPEFPHPDTHCYDEDTKSDVWSHSEANMHAYGLACIKMQASHTAAADDVLAERQRQIHVEGWSAERDDKYTNCELARAAATYAVCSHVEQLQICGERAWPWHIDWFKRTTYRRDLVKAGALIIAEIERLDRDDCRAIKQPTTAPASESVATLAEQLKAAPFSLSPHLAYAVAAHTAAQVAASKPADMVERQAYEGMKDERDRLKHLLEGKPAAASGEAVYQVRLNGVWHDVTLEAQKHYDESKRRVLFTAPALPATGEALTDDEILRIGAPYLSDDQGFARKPELFEIVAFARAIIAALKGA